MSSNDLRQNSQWRFAIAQLAALVTGCAVVLPVEFRRASAAVDFGAPAVWFSEMNLDTSPFLLLFIVLPLFWFARRALWRPRSWRRRRKAAVSRDPSSGTSRREDRRAWCLALFVAVASLGASLWTASRPVAGAEVPFGELPPAYHDEYSYLLQAKTFLSGRLWFPQADDIFDQVHVLNDGGRFASRFFPGTGAWMAPFVAIGKPYWGHWLAGALTAFFVFWAGRELAGDRVGLLAGLLTALSPGMALFSNLLLAHHPCLVGLGVFLFAFLRMMRSPCPASGVAAGAGLSFAMLCRPLTAAGFALPFGLWFAWWICFENRWGDDTEDGPGRTRRLLLGGVVALPLLAGLAVQAGYNRALTGRWFKTPYSRYTEIYTPRHVYGFNNVERGRRRLGPKVLDNYDRWAENLEPAIFERDSAGRLRPSLAVRNVWQRLQASFRWSLALVPLAMAAVTFLIIGWGPERRWWLIFASVVSLHALHVPYWYDGIMHWHYVFETGPLWLLILAGTTVRLADSWRHAQRPLMPIWWGGVLLASALTTYAALPPFWSQSRLQGEITKVAYSRVRYAAFRQLLDSRIGEDAALVLVEPDPVERHIDYVVNDPGLNSQILVGRYRPGRTDLDRVCSDFPERACYLYRARSGELVALETER